MGNRKAGLRKGEGSGGCLGCVGTFFLLTVLISMYQHGRPAFLLTQDELRATIRLEIQLEVRRAVQEELRRVQATPVPPTLQERKDP